MRVFTLPCFTDNFVYLAGLAGKKEVVVIDPGHAGVVIEAVKQHGLELCGILTTHHHADHVGGNKQLLNAFGPLPVYGHSSEIKRIPTITELVNEGDRVQVAGLTFEVLFVPGHTRSHLAYYAQEHGTLFIGDTLFAGGCGRLFEGTPQMMHRSLNERLAALPDETKVFFAHEYTEANLRFALTVDRENPDLIQRVKNVREHRLRGNWTTPTTLGLERATNPFLRVSTPGVAGPITATAGRSLTDVEVFAAVRKAKDNF